MDHLHAPRHGRESSRRDSSDPSAATAGCQRAGRNGTVTEGSQAGPRRGQGTLAHIVFEQLDYIYEPSPDVATDIVYFEKVMGGQIVFAVEGMGARVAMVQLTEGPPHILLTDHLEGDRPIFIYRVDDLDRALAQLESRGWNREGRLEIPMGPCCSFTTPGGHRIALYQMARPEVTRHFEGRRDF